MDPRMYPLATYLHTVRQDWPLHAIQTELAGLDHLPYGDVAVGSVRAAMDSTVAHPRGIRSVLTRQTPATPTPGPLCQVCRRPHDPDRPDQHVPAPVPESVVRGAAMAREALRAALTPKDPPPVEAQLELDTAGER